MRFVRIIPFLLLAAAACGDDNSNTRRDAAPGRDSSPDDGDVDDAPPDGPPAGGPRVWVVGDFITNDRRQAGSFLTDATLPFNTATPTPVLIPSGATAALATSSAQVFHTNGSKVAYLADSTLAGRFDLYVADANGANPVLVVEGPVAPQEISAVALSPDGTKVAYTMDTVLLNNNYDLFVAPTTAAATPTKISPDRTGTPATPPATKSVFSVFTWSSDSKYVAFSADLEDESFDQVYVTDTTPAAPTTSVILARADIAATSGTRGVRGAILFDPANNVYFRARVDNANTLFKLFKSSPTDGTTKTIVTLPMRGDATTPDVGAFGITPDGTKLVYSADAPTLAAYDMYVATIAAPNTSTKITNLTGPGRANVGAPLAFSFDSTKVAVGADFQTANLEPYVIHLDGSATRRLVSVATACANCDATVLQWDPDNTTLWAMGDITVANDTKAFKLDSTMMDQTPTLAVDVPTGGDLVNLFVRP